MVPSLPRPALLALVIAWALLARPSYGGATTEATLVFLTKGDACDCVASLCVAGEQEVLNFLETVGERLRYRHIDLAVDAEAGKRYRAITLPVVVLLDPSGEEVGRFDSFFTAAQLRELWNQRQASGGDRR